MKKFLFLLIGVMLSFSLFAADAVYERTRPNEIVGWSIFGADDDIDASAELVTELDTTYAQLAAEDTIEVLSGSASDTSQTVTVYGIDNSGEKTSEEIEVNGTTEVESDTTFRYIDQVEVDAECAGVITVRRATGDTFITSIPIGTLEATMVQHFNGEDVSYITGWRASVTSTTGTVKFELRSYPDDADCLDASDGYKVLDEIAFTNVLGTQDRPFPQPIKVSEGGWIAVYATGGSVNSDGSVTVQGFDSFR